jgi:hypothetical protein
LQRLLGRRRAQPARGHRVVDRRRQVAEELLHLPVLRLSARFDPTLLVGDAQGHQHRVVLREQPRLPPVVLLLLRLPCWAGRGGVHHGFQLLGDPQLVRLGGRPDVPVAERLVEEVVHDRPRGLTRLVVRGVRLGVVVRRDLQPPAGLQVDVPKLDASPARRPALLAPGGDRAHQDGVVEQDSAQTGQGAEERFGHCLSLAAPRRRPR